MVAWTINVLRARGSEENVRRDARRGESYFRYNGLREASGLGKLQVHLVRWWWCWVRIVDQLPVFWRLV